MLMLNNLCKKNCYTVLGSIPASTTTYQCHFSLLGKHVQAILSAAWMQKQLIAHKFTTGQEAGTIAKMKPKGKKGGEDDGEREWLVKYKSETESSESESFDEFPALPKDRFGGLWLFAKNISVVWHSNLGR